MPFIRRNMLCLRLAAGLLAAPAASRAQVPAMLLGQWEMRQVSFVATHTVPPDMLERMDNPEVAALNQEMTANTARLLVEFRVDGTYQFTVARVGQAARIEVGTYFVRDGTLFAQSPATQGGASFDNQRLVQLSRRRLVVEFLVGDDLPGILEEVAYRRAQ